MIDIEIPIEDCVTYMWDANPIGVDVYVITFNNTFLVEYQIKTLRKFFKAPFNLFVVDNNNQLHADQSREVFDLCIEKKIAYIKAPDNYYQRPETFDPSMKLGTTMNWLYQQCVLKRWPTYFGYLDHDCFITKPFDVRPYLDINGMYGEVARNEKNGAWNLHPAVNFYRLDFVGHLPLDFRASHKYQLDTGGANYDILYHNFDHHDYVIGRESFRYAADDVNRKDSVQHYVVIDGGRWYHMSASSHDQLVGDGLYKLAYTKGYLDGRLQT